MNKGTVCGVIGAAIFMCLNASSLADLADYDVHQEDRLPYREGRMMVRTEPSVLDDALVSIENEIHAHRVKTYGLVPGLRLYDFDESIPIEDALNIFQTSGLVVYAEPDYILTAADQNDPRLQEQWALENLAQTGGQIDADINASAMWAITQGSPNIVIGVIDSGVDYNHSDLAANMWRNALEIPNDGIDQDGNGYVDDVFGINAISNSGNPLDDNAHGTHVAGIIGAVGNNGFGIVGVMPQVKIAACKFLAANGSGSTSDAIECLQYLAHLKTRAIDPVNIVATNNSWGSTQKSTALENAIRAHQNLGILFAAAGGNSALNTDVAPYYPASFELANVIAVAATDSADRLATFSNYGKRSIHVGAPGVRILSSVLNDTYALFSGTSMATPHVVGLAGLIKARFPAFDYHQIKNLIIASGTPLQALQNTSISGRRIRGADSSGSGALTCVNQIINSRIKPTANALMLYEGQRVLLSSLRINCSEPLGPIVLYSDAHETIMLADEGANGDAIARDGIFSVNWQPSHTGSYALDFGNGDVVTIVVNASPHA